MRYLEIDGITFTTPHCFAFSENENFLVISVAIDRKSHLRAWSEIPREEIIKDYVIQGEVRYLAISDDAKLIACGFENKKIVMLG